MSAASRIQAEFKSLVESLDLLPSVLDHEPATLPRQLPALTMLFRGGVKDADEIGPSVWIIWQWSVRLYVSLTEDYGRAQHQLRDLWVALCALDQTYVTLNDAASGGWELVDENPDTEPEFDLEEGWLLKRFVLRAASHEGG